MTDCYGNIYMSSSDAQLIQRYLRRGGNPNVLTDAQIVAAARVLGWLGGK